MLTIGKVAQVTFALALPTSIILIYWWYKNRSDEDAYENKRVVTSRNTSIEVKVPQQAIGAIIGRQGSKIKQIQKETGTRIHFQGKDTSDSGGGDGSCKIHHILVIQGNPESVHQAELMVHQIIADVSQILTEEIEVPCYALGRLIGKGGATIREMTSLSGAKITIDRNDSRTNPNLPRTVSLTGSREQIDIALELIQANLEIEEEFRAKLSMTEANKKDRKTDNEPTEPIKLIPVPQKDESWDLTSTTCLPRQEKLLNCATVEVYVSAIEHPGHFWVQMIRTKALQLEQLQNDITTFASSDDAKLNYAVTEIRPGDLVASRFEDGDLMYYRAQVLGETEDGKVDLYFVDFGDNSDVNKEDIFRLRSDFTVFPFQAIECMLANVEPVDGEWSEEAITSFENMTHCAKWKHILARVVSYRNLKEGENMPVVQLLDTTDSQEIDIGAELVKQGYALSVDSVGTNSQASGADGSFCI